MMPAVMPTSSAAGRLRLILLGFLSRVWRFHWLRPSILFAFGNPGPARSSSGTSWLDGLRGVASMQVFFFHFFGRYSNWNRTYGSSPEDNYIHQLPIFRSIWGAGSSAVSVFFVISGYAVTVRSLSLLRRKQYDDLYKGLCSSLVRRGFRLYLPLIFLSIPMLIMIRTLDMARDGYVYESEVMDSWHNQFIHLLNATDDHINPFMYPDTNPSHNRFAYIPPSWTIPMEYQGSIAVYLLIMIVSRIEFYWTRSVILGGMAFYSLHRGAWWTSGFVVGMLLADYQLGQQITTSKSSIGKDRDIFRVLHTVFYVLVFCMGFYLAGIPPEHVLFDWDPKPKPGYEIFYKLYPPYYLFRIGEPVRWYWYWSGTFTVVSISQLPLMRAVLDTRFCQWLGKLSFSLYLVHSAIIAALGTPLQGMIATVTENKGIQCMIEFAVLAPIIFILSGVVERYIDQPSVRLAKRIEQYLWRERPAAQEELSLASRDVEMVGLLVE